jgi:hypothetical protein
MYAGSLRFSSCVFSIQAEDRRPESVGENARADTYCDLKDSRALGAPSAPGEGPSEFERIGPTCVEKHSTQLSFEFLFIDSGASGFTARIRHLCEGPFLDRWFERIGNEGDANRQLVDRCSHLSLKVADICRKGACYPIPIIAPTAQS